MAHHCPGGVGLDCTYIKGRIAKVLNKFRFLSDFLEAGPTSGEF